MKLFYFGDIYMKTYRFRSRIDNPGYHLPSTPNQKLDHLPGPTASWLTGHIRRFISDDSRYINEQASRYGNLFTIPSLFGKHRYALLPVFPW